MNNYTRHVNQANNHLAKFPKYFDINYQIIEEGFDETFHIVSLNEIFWEKIILRDDIKAAELLLTWVAAYLNTILPATLRLRIISYPDFLMEGLSRKPACIYF